MKGVLNINKPKGFTSQDVVSVVRGILKTRAVGHMGTLDPQGEGVLLIGIGKGTRLFDLMLTKDKVYEAEFDFGYETDTLDGDGKIERITKILPNISQIKSTMPDIIGEIDQIPPKYSAKNIDGKRAYDLARAGKSFDLKPSRVTVYDIQLLTQTGENKYLFRIHCSGGTYVRSICRDLAYACNSLATMTSIRRVRCGAFDLSDAITLDELRERGADAILSLDEALSFLPRHDVSDLLYEKLCNGVKIHMQHPNSSPFTVYCKGELFGIGAYENGFVRIKSYLRD